MSLKIATHALAFIVLGTVLTAGTPLVLNSEGAFERSAVVAEMSRSQIAAGDRALLNGRFGTAVEAYRIAANLDRARQRLPEEALRRVANAHYFNGEYGAAAGALTDLADEAAAAGERSVEFWAAVDAAWMDRLAEDEAGLRRNITRAQLLLDHGAFPETERVEVERTVTNWNLRPYAPHLATW